MAHAVSFPTAAYDVDRTPVGSPRAARPRAVRRPMSAGIRLTRRGRLVAFAASLVVLLLVVVLSSALSAQADSTDRGAATGVVVVQPGESLWQIAQRIAPDSDPRAVVTELRDLNDLGHRPPSAGQSLLVPRYAVS
jgi:hypothetical protein